MAKQKTLKHEPMYLDEDAHHNSDIYPGEGDTTFDTKRDVGLLYCNHQWVIAWALDYDDTNVIPFLPLDDDDDD